MGGKGKGKDSGPRKGASKGKKDKGAVDSAHMASDVSPLVVGKHTGIFRDWHTDNDYGFILVDGVGEDVFFHVSALPKDTRIKRDDRVSFIVDEIEATGRSRAKHIELFKSRDCCRFGAGCFRKSEAHLSEFAHPGDPDWVDVSIFNSDMGAPAMSLHACTLPSSSLPPLPPPVRENCRHGVRCFRANPEHLKEFAHPGDADWLEARGGVSVEANAIHVHTGKSRCGKDDRLGLDRPKIRDWDVDRTHAAPSRAAVGHDKGSKSDVGAFLFAIAPKWLHSLSHAQKKVLVADLSQLAGKFGLEYAIIVEGDPNEKIELKASSHSTLDMAQKELCADGGLLVFYEERVRPRSSDPAAGAARARQSSEEAYIDPATGRRVTWDELNACYSGTYSSIEIEKYWVSMKKDFNAHLQAESIVGLRAWLTELGLSGYHDAAAQWAEDQGACCLDEVQQFADNFATDLGLTRSERFRLLAAADKSS